MHQCFRSFVSLVLLGLLGPFASFVGAATADFTPFLNSRAGLRLLESVPQGARLLERMGGPSGLQRLTQQDRWRLDQMLQDLYFRGPREDRLAFQVGVPGDAPLRFSSQTLKRLDQGLSKLQGESATVFFLPPGATGRSLAGPPLPSRSAFLSGQPQAPEWGELLRSPFVTDEYSQNALSSLSEEGAVFLARRLLSVDQSRVQSLVGQKVLQLSTGHSFEVTTRLMISHSTSSGGRPAEELFQSGVLTQLVTARDQVTGSLSGFLILKFEPAAAGASRWEPHLDLIKVDPNQPQARGLGGALFDELVSTVTSLGAPRLLLNADWSGRLVWAKKGFRFDPDYRPQVDGREVTQTALFQANFLRFLETHHLSVQELGIQSGSEVIPLRRVQQLVEPRDFAQVVALDGRKLVTDQYVDLWRFRESVEADVGVAFLLKPYFSKIGQRRAVFQPDDSSFVADDAAPSWMGMLELKSKRFEKLLKVK